MECKVVYLCGSIGQYLGQWDRTDTCKMWSPECRVVYIYLCGSIGQSYMGHRMWSVRHRRVLPGISYVVCT